MEDKESGGALEFGRILACVAEGSHSDHALRAAVDLAGRFNSELELLHAVPVPDLLGTRFAPSQIEAMNAARCSEARRVVLAHWAHEHPGVQLGDAPLEEFLNVLPGVPAKVILDRAEETSCDLIFLGDNGKRKNLDFGGVARALFGKSSCPVWLQVSRPRPIERLLAPIDLSEHSLAALGTAVGLAEKLGAHVTALHAHAILEPAYAAGPFGAHDVALAPDEHARADAREQFEATLRDFDWRGVSHDSAFVDESAVAAILGRQHQIDLIVMGTHGRTGLAAAVLGGVAYQVLRTASTPVLAIRQPKRPWLL